MRLESLKYSNEDAAKYKLESNLIHFKTDLAFLKIHNGLRLLKMHLLLSPTHGGKSTLVRSVVFDMLKNNKLIKILIILSEETIEEFKAEFSKTFPAHEILENVTLISEQDGCNSIEDTKINIKEAIEMSDCEIVFYDNITTSTLYPDDFKTQESTALWLKALSKKITLFLIAHTNDNSGSSKLLTESDIRGSKKLPNLVEFLYILQPIMVGNTMFQFINIRKHRGQETENKMFRLFYDPYHSIFKNDKGVNFEDVKEVFLQRNKLDDKR